MTMDNLSNSKHLLLVDDDRIVLSIIGQELTVAGYAVTIAKSVDQAEEILSSGVRPDLVILDLNLPNKHGLTLAQTLRGLDNIPFVVFSAYNDLETVENVKQAGAVGYLVKPLDVLQMIPSLEAALARAMDINRLKTEGVHLQSALDAERDIRVAVGIIMMQQRLDKRGAYTFLRSTARAQRRKLSEVSSEVVRSVEALHKN